MVSTSRSRKRVAPERLPARDRRSQLLRTAAELLRREGIDGLELTRLAAEAGVSRPIVYRFFESRHALIVGLLEDLASELDARFARLTARPFPVRIEDATRLFVDAACDAIEAKGVGPWELLGSRGPDPAIARLAGRIHKRLLAPWYARVAAATGVGAREAETLSSMLVAAARAVLQEWYTGGITREEAVRDATRGVSGLLAAFAAGASSAPPRRRRPS
jgi:AcrR family transcriptional regulator